MRAVLRILIVIPLGFVLAIVSATALIILSAGAEPQPGEPEGFFTAKLVVATLLASTYVGSVAGIASLIAIVAAEILRWRSFIGHLVVGMAIGLFAYWTGIGGDPPIASQDLATGAAAGAVGGFVYWLIAGRGAGLLRKRPPEPEES